MYFAPQRQELGPGPDRPRNPLLRLGFGRGTLLAMSGEHTGTKSEPDGGGIEVTPEMLAAGHDVLCLWRQGEDSAKQVGELLAEVFRVMASLCPRNPGMQGTHPRCPRISLRAIDAGVAAYRGWNPSKEEVESLVADIYLSMSDAHASLFRENSTRSRSDSQEF